MTPERYKVILEIDKAMDRIENESIFDTLERVQKEVREKKMKDPTDV